MRKLAMFFAVVSLLLAAGCATQTAPQPQQQPVEWTTIPATVPGASFSHELATLALRRAAFHHAWRIVNDRFYDPRFNGVDWEAVGKRYLPEVDKLDSDNAFYALISRMAGELKDSHTRVYTAREYKNRLDSVISTYGLRVAEVDGKVAIVQVFPDTDAARAGLRKGMVIETIEGERAIDRLAKLRAESPQDVSPERRTRGIFGRLISGRSDRLSLDVAAVDGASGSARYELKRNEREIPLVVAHETLPGNIGYVTFNRFRPEAAADFARAVASLHGTDGLIIDLRGNPGGSLGSMLSIARNFFPETRHVMTRQLRPVTSSSPEGEGFGSPRSMSDTAPPEMRILATASPYTQPIAVLLDNYSASSSELLATILREQRGAAIIGRPTCGCVVAVRPNGYKLAGGGALYVSESGFVSPYGTRMEGVPMKPDREVALKLADLEAGIDRDIVVAKEMLQSRPSREADAPLN
jgi:carboxyl-terminal processing protease